MRDAYRVYVADSLYCAPRNKQLNKRYAEIIDRTKVDTRSGDEIAAEVIERAGLIL